MSKRILIFGATGGTGLPAAKIMVERGDTVTAFVRPTSDRSALEQLGVELVEGNLLDADSVTAAVTGADFDAIASAFGGQRGEPRPDLDGTKNMVDAAKAAGIQRIVMVTAVGAGDSADALSPKAWEFLGPVIELKTLAEDYLTNSGLDYTILRPGGMTSNAATGTAILSDDHSVMGMINRADLGALVVDCLDDDTTIGRIYHTVDPEIDELPPLQRGEDLPSARKP